MAPFGKLVKIWIFPFLSCPFSFLVERGKSKVRKIDYPLLNIRLIISGQCYAFWATASSTSLI